MAADGSLNGLKREFGAVSFVETYTEAAPATVSDARFGRHGNVPDRRRATDRHHATGKSGKAARGANSRARRPAIADVFVNISDGVCR